MTLRPDPINKYAYNMLISLHPRQQYRHIAFYLSLMLLKRNLDGSYLQIQWSQDTFTSRAKAYATPQPHSVSQGRSQLFSNLLFIQINNYGDLNKLVLCNFEGKLSRNRSVHLCLLLLDSTSHIIPITSERTFVDSQGRIIQGVIPLAWHYL